MADVEPYGLRAVGPHERDDGIVVRIGYRRFK